MGGLKVWVTSCMERWRARSTSRRIGTLHVKIDQLTRRMAQLAATGTDKQGGSRAQEVDKGTQIALGLKYRELLAAQVVLPLPEVEFRNYSQSGEDGILHYIFSLIGSGSRRAVEICAGNGSECNSANLVIHHGWHALLVDGSEKMYARAGHFLPNTLEPALMAPYLSTPGWIATPSTG